MSLFWFWGISKRTKMSKFKSNVKMISVHLRGCLAGINKIIICISINITIQSGIKYKIYDQIKNYLRPLKIPFVIYFSLYVWIIIVLNCRSHLIITWCFLFFLIESIHSMKSLSLSSGESRLIFFLKICFSSSVSSSYET